MTRRAVIFDLDGTLIDSASDIAIVLNRMLSSRGLPPTHADAVKKLVSYGAKDIIKAIFGAVAETMNIDEAFAEFQATYRSIPPNPDTLFPYAMDMLKQLQQQKYAIAICTNKPEDNARRILSGIGLDPYLQSIVGKRDGLPAKPNPAPVFEILKQLGLASSDAIYVGDNEVDAETAKAAAMPFLLVSFGYPTGNIDTIPRDGLIDDFRELPNMLLEY